MKVKFLPSGEEYEIEINETVLHLAQRSGLHIQSVCKGIPSCAECRVRLVEGEYHVPPPSKKELNLIGTAHYVDLSRLSCQLRCFGDVTIDLSEQIEKEKRVQKKSRNLDLRKDGQKSKAVLGSLLNDMKNSFKELSEKSDENQEGSEKNNQTQNPGNANRKNHKNKNSVRTSNQHPSLDRKNLFYGNFYNENQNKKSKKRRQKTSQRKNNPLNRKKRERGS